jgi:hypothetical protein
MKPMPSPYGTNYAGLFLPSSFAMDELPRAVLSGAAGGEGGTARDQDDPDDNGGSVYASQTEATAAKLMKLLRDRLQDDDFTTAATLVEQLFGHTDTTGARTAMASDGRRRAAPMPYSVRFPNANRLRRRTF